ncbi:Uncharacterised protein [BD1-7 clade bacterium]|uniref:ATPase AAA-type core domain-containing protein n=1 Tax=BD1-7 clade bacterium TaxID=2029982 RepID=A0A5S9PCE5_9GAMM|nr:Uncharacterised protein [BD1-7 clade bacterium]
MRLKRLEIIGEYKAIQGTEDTPFVYDFNNTPTTYSPLCLVGLNGSGKSNFIELIADIFGYADRYFNEQYDCKMDLGYRFKIEYEINHHGECYRVRLIGQPYGLSMYLNGGDACSIESDHHQFLPTRVVAYSSGSNQGLSSVFAKSQFQYYEVIRKQAAFYRGFQRRYDAVSGLEDGSEQELIDYKRRRYQANSDLFEIPRDMNVRDYFNQLDLGEPLKYRDTALPIGLFTDHTFSQLVFIFLLVTRNPDFQHFISEEIKIDSLSSFELDLRLSAFRDFEVVKDIANRLIKLSAGSQGLPTMTCPQTFNERTLSGVLPFTFNDAFLESFESLYLDETVFLKHLITLTQLVAKKWSGDEKRSLRTSQYTRNVPNLSGGLAPIRIINTKITLSQPDTETLYDRLSDGEHQLMQVIGSLIMFADEQALFILDEPESHFNPEWRMEFIELISRYVDASNLDILISTHSPFVLSACKAERVLNFSKDESGHVEISGVESETYGASFDTLLTTVFDLDVLISKKPLAEIQHILSQHEGDLISMEDTLRNLEQYGDSFELNLRRNRLRRQLDNHEGSAE